MSLALLFHYSMLNMFRMLIHPSSGACDLFVGLFHGLYCSGSMCVGVNFRFGWGGVVQAETVSLYATIKTMDGSINISQTIVRNCRVVENMHNSG